MLVTLLCKFSKINTDYLKNIKILNNCSTCEKTIEYLKCIESTHNVIHNTNNSGPWITEHCNSHVYNTLPSKFILTDPDLEFNKELPINFIETLIQLSDKYSCYKIGFGLDISDFDKMFQTDNYAGKLNIYNWETQFWNNRILNDNEYELYYADIDTTFCLVNKLVTHDKKNNIRICGNFLAKHLPWYTDNKIHNICANYKKALNDTNISTISKNIVKYTEDNYIRVNKNNEFFLIEKNKNDNNLHFWENIYTNWENETFEVFDKYLNVDKVMIDIGGWIGTTAMYGSRKSKHVYCVEADNYSFIDMTKNFKINCEEGKYTLIHNAIFNIDDTEIRFGKNLFLDNSKLNDSTSQIYNETIYNTIFSEYNIVKTVTLQSIINNNHIDPYEISLIKVDIEGGEEYILNGLFELYKQYNIPMYISFHYSWWNDKNLDRFTFLSETHKNNICAYPFISILFT